MIDRYGTAVVEERLNDLRMAPLERELAREYGPGTTVAFVRVQAADRTATSPAPRYRGASTPTGMIVRLLRSLGSRGPSRPVAERSR